MTSRHHLQITFNYMPKKTKKDSNLQGLLKDFYSSLLCLPKGLILPRVYRFAISLSTMRVSNPPPPLYQSGVQPSKLNVQVIYTEGMLLRYYTLYLSICQEDFSQHDRSNNCKSFPNNKHNSSLSLYL